MTSRERAEKYREMARQWMPSDDEDADIGTITDMLLTVATEARREALEEAAKAFRDSDNVERMSVLEIEAAIRALKEKKP